jgi:hypothetical protein
MAMRPRKLTVTEWTESRDWTESTETFEAKRSAQAQPFSRKGHVRCRAAVPTCVVNPPASPERYVAHVLQLLIVICWCRKLTR